MSKPQYHFWYSATTKAKRVSENNKSVCTAMIEDKEVEYTSWSPVHDGFMHCDSVYLGMGFMHKINGRVQDD